MGARENKAAVRCLIEQCVNRHRLDLLDDIVASDVVIYPSTPNRYVDGVGLDEFRGFLATIQHVFTGLQFRIDDLIAEGDRVSVRWTATGIHTSEWLGFQPAFTPVTVGGMDLYEFRDEKIQRWWRIADLYGLVDQLERADSGNKVAQWAD